ncbi:MAG: Hsp20/alpha crystallin family protein [Gammaproteobacteria bacterium]
MSRDRNPYSMWADACALLDRAERLQRQFFEPVGLARRPTWEPPADLFEAEDGLLIIVALPGVRAQQLQLLFDGADLIVTGERALPPETAGLAIRRLEIPAGRFERRIPLPAGRFDVVERRFADGCLTLFLRRL